MKKLFEEIDLLINSPSTKSDSKMVTDLFHILIWGGSLLASIFGVIMFIMFIVLSFKTGLERTLPIFLYSVGSIFLSYILIKLRIGLYSKE
ncbi:hypothetical protein ABXT43_04405 [Candidatus Pelagibacter sp. Uisw_114]